MSTVIFEITDIIKNGININICNDKLIKLDIIHIKIVDNGIINYGDVFEKLINFTNAKQLSQQLKLIIYEDINTIELYCNYLNLNTQIALNINKKIRKLIISSNEKIDLDLDIFEDLIYLREIVLNVNTANIITIKNGNNIKQNINIVIYENS